MFEMFKKKKHHIQHKHLIVRAEVDDANLDTGTLEIWTADLIRRMGMECLSGPHASMVYDKGNVGPTVIASLKTSHMAMHIWTEYEGYDLIEFDFYTCGEMDVDIIRNHLDMFGLQKIEMKLLDREHGLEEMPV